MANSGNAQSSKAMRTLAGCLGLLCSLPAQAQHAEPPPATLAPISVLGQVSQENPSSRTVLNHADLQDAGISNVQDLARHTPGVTLSDQGSQRFQVNTIRGIGNTVRQDYFNSTLGVYLDGVPLTTAEYNRRLGDIAQVEILRGPQGTLFGHNAMAGVINLTSRAPTASWQAEASATAGNRGQRGGDVWFSGTLSPQLTARAFLDYAKRDGYTRYATAPGSIDGLESFTASGALRYRPDTRMTLALHAAVEHVDQGAYAYQAYDDYRRRRLDIQKPNAEVRDNRSLTALADINLNDKLQLKSITAWRDYDVDSEQDLTYNTFIRLFGGGRTSADEDGRQLSQEFRLLGQSGQIDWLLGGLFLREKTDYRYVFDVPAFGPASLSRYAHTRREVAGFGELTWRVNDALELIAGLRWSRERHRLVNHLGAQPQASYTSTAPKFVLAYRFLPEKQVYASAIRGVRAGGFNRLTNDPAYGSESLWSYETGVKTQWLDRRLTLNATVFYIDWQDQQINTQIAPGVVRTNNAGKSHSQGVELEAQWQVSPGLDVHAYWGVTQGKYDSFISAAGANLKGNKLVNTPNTTAGLALQYRQTVPFLAGAQAFMRGEYQHVGAQYFDVENRLKQNAYGVVNLRTGLEYRHVSVTLFVKNLFDQHYRSYGYRDFANTPFASDIAVAGQPRMIGVNVMARY